MLAAGLAGVVGQADARGLDAQRPGLVERLVPGVVLEGVDRAEVHQAAHALLEHRLADVAHALAVDAVDHAVRVAVDGDLAGEVEDDLAALEGGLEARRVEHVGLHRLELEPVERPRVLGVERADFVAGLEQRADEVSADVSGCADDRDLHVLPPRLVLGIKGGATVANPSPTARSSAGHRDGELGELGESHSSSRSYATDGTDVTGDPEPGRRG
ncbi:MAG: hypothetical protein QM765_33065 [Myxococcales bacterium]